MASSQPPPNIRIQTVGPQETVDWLQALENFSNRMETVERALRLHGQTLGQINEQVTGHRGEYTKYKRCIENTFQNIDKHIGTQIKGADDGLNDFISGPVADGWMSIFRATNDKLQALDA